MYLTVPTTIPLLLTPRAEVCSTPLAQGTHLGDFAVGGESLLLLLLLVYLLYEDPLGLLLLMVQLLALVSVMDNRV